MDVEDVCGFGKISDGLGEAVGAGGVVGRGHHGFAPEVRDGGGDALVIGGDDDFRELSGRLAAFPNMLDQGLARDGMEGLAGEACGAPTSR